MMKNSARCPDCGADVPSIFEHVDGCPPGPVVVDTFFRVSSRHDACPHANCPSPFICRNGCKTTKVAS
ncbi:hypothetical protein ACVIF9_006694 [Bradyrhizobium sp. USDA 4350]